jgi:hypothetical protein
VIDGWDWRRCANAACTSADRGRTTGSIWLARSTGGFAADERLGDVHQRREHQVHQPHDRPAVDPAFEDFLGDADALHRVVDDLRHDLLEQPLADAVFDDVPGVGDKPRGALGPLGQVLLRQPRAQRLILLVLGLFERSIDVAFGSLLAQLFLQGGQVVLLRIARADQVHPRRNRKRQCARDAP